MQASVTSAFQVFDRKAFRHCKGVPEGVPSSHRSLPYPKTSSITRVTELQFV